ncbi:MAG: hypothetical protein IJX27_00235 [Clostridia bacterium]|nr:hypothetical protein [Clostridia bacterium]
MNETFETSALEATTPVSFLKSTFTSGKKMLVIVIAFAVSLLSGLIGIFATRFNIMAYVSEFLGVIEETGVALDSSVLEAIDALVSVANVIDAIFICISVINLVPVALMAAGAFLIYYGVTKDDFAKATLGTLLFRILFIYQIVMNALGICATLLCAFILAAAVGELAVLVFIIAIIVCAPMVLSALYYGKFAKMLKELGVTIRTNINTLKVSSYVTVINWIFAVCGIISAVSSLGSSFIGGLGELLSAVALMFVAMLFSDYKEEFGDPTSENIEAAKECK